MKHKIALVCGSPKDGESVTRLLLEKLAAQLDGAELTWIDLADTDGGDCRVLEDVQTVVLAFPLYFDSIPAHVLSWMQRIEQAVGGRAQCRVYALINCAMYEGGQCRWAAQSVSHWAARCGFQWGAALCVGGGPLLLQKKRRPLGRGLRSAVRQGVYTLAGQIQGRAEDIDQFLSPKLPRKVYQLGSTWVCRRIARQTSPKKQ